MGLRRTFVAALLALAWGAPALGQEAVGATVVRVEVSAAVGSTGEAYVEILYTLTGGEEGDSVAATFLSLGQTAPADLTLITPGEQRQADYPMRRGPLRQHAATLPLTPDGQGGSRLRVGYRVMSAVAGEGGDLRVHVPILFLDAPHAGSDPAFFTARLAVPSAWSVSETFPTDMPYAEGSGDSAIFAATLPVVPATLSLRAHEDGRWHPGLPLLLDVLTLIVVVGFTLLGWRHLREEAA